jgi:hypothetical protein
MGWRITPRKLEKRAITIPVHKEGNVKDCRNYRGRNTLNSGYKLYDNIIKNLYIYYKSKLCEEQNRF